MSHPLNGPPFAMRLVAGLLSLMLWLAAPAFAGQARRPAEPPATLPERPFEGELAAPPYPFNPDKPYAHPYYWPPFVLYGNWR